MNQYQNQYPTYGNNALQMPGGPVYPGASISAPGIPGFQGNFPARHPGQGAQTNGRIDLSAMDSEWANTPLEPKKEFPDVPDGKYQVKVDKVELTASKVTGNPMLKWDLVILVGPYEGQHLFRNNMLASPENLKYLKTDLHTCGVDLPRLSALESSLSQLLDITLEVQQKSRRDNNGNDQKNVYINKRIDVARASKAAVIPGVPPMPGPTGITPIQVIAHPAVPALSAPVNRVEADQFDAEDMPF